VHLRRGELVRVAAVDADAHWIARLDERLAAAIDDVTREDLLGRALDDRGGSSTSPRAKALVKLNRPPCSMICAVSASQPRVNCDSAISSPACRRATIE
jgi:hypothetical protein